MSSLFTLESLLNTHASPFVIIDASLTVFAVNHAWRQQFAAAKEVYIGQPCCDKSPHCRHQRAFMQLEPYAANYHKEPDRLIKIRGYPLFDGDGKVYLGESIEQMTTALESVDSALMVGKSSTFCSFRTQLLDIALKDTPILLNGEVGAGMAQAAEFIHKNSSRNKHKLLTVDCSILNEKLVANEFFGHEKQICSGNISVQKGILEMADQGTLLLDEIGDLSLSLQQQLLDVLSTGQYTRVGGVKPLPVNVRMIGATVRNLQELVKTGEFREDLLRELSADSIKVPSLRERLADVPDLVDFFLARISRSSGNQYTLDKDALIKLIKHSWPGNIEELKNCLQLSASICHQNRITINDIDSVMQQKSNVIDLRTRKEIFDPTLSPLAQMETEVIRSLITKYQGNKKLIAAELDISERTLYRKLKRFNLK